MKQFRLLFGLALIPICAFLGSFVPIGRGSGLIIGFVVGSALAYLFLTYGPGHKKNQLPPSYYARRAILNQVNLRNSGWGLSAPWNLREKEASGAQEEDENEEHIASYEQEEDRAP